MNWMNLVASLIDSLAWPGILCVILIVFRRDITGLFQQLSHFKYHGLEIDFCGLKQNSMELHDTDQAMKMVIEKDHMYLSMERQFHDVIKNLQRWLL